MCQYEFIRNKNQSLDYLNMPGKLFVTALSLLFMIQQGQAVNVKELDANWFLKDTSASAIENASAEDLLATFSDSTGTLTKAPDAVPVKLLGDRFDFRHYQDQKQSILESSQEAREDRESTEYAKLIKTMEGKEQYLDQVDTIRYNLKISRDHQSQQLVNLSKYIKAVYESPVRATACPQCSRPFKG